MKCDRQACTGTDMHAMGHAVMQQERQSGTETDSLAMEETSMKQNRQPGTGTDSHAIGSTVMQWDLQSSSGIDSLTMGEDSQGRRTKSHAAGQKYQAVGQTFMKQIRLFGTDPDRNRALEETPRS